MRLTRRTALLAAASATVAPLLALCEPRRRVPQLRVTGFELLPIRATSRTVWLIVRLRTDAGLVGWRSIDAFGFANTTADDAARMRSQLATFFNLINGRSPFESNPIDSAARRWRDRGSFRHSLQRDRAGSLGSRRQGTRRPTYVLLRWQGPRQLCRSTRTSIARRIRARRQVSRPLRRAVADGFRAIKAAPWDGFRRPARPTLRSHSPWIRHRVGGCDARGCRPGGWRSWWTVTASSTSSELCAWPNGSRYDSDCAGLPDKVDETVAIRRRIRRWPAITLFGLSGFAPLPSRAWTRSCRT